MTLTRDIDASLSPWFCAQAASTVRYDHIRRILDLIARLQYRRPAGHRQIAGKRIDAGGFIQIQGSCVDGRQPCVRIRRRTRQRQRSASRLGERVARAIRNYEEDTVRNSIPGGHSTTTGTGELKAVARAAWDVGAHALHVEGDWLDNMRTSRMSNRNQDNQGQDVRGQAGVDALKAALS